MRDGLGFGDGGGGVDGSSGPWGDRVRFEVLPLGNSDEEAAQLPEPVRLTVTCSPKLGPDRSVEVASALRGSRRMRGSSTRTPTTPAARPR